MIKCPRCSQFTFASGAVTECRLALPRWLYIPKTCRRKHVVTCRVCHVCRNPYSIHPIPPKPHGFYLWVAANLAVALATLACCALFLKSLLV